MRAVCQEASVGLSRTKKVLRSALARVLAPAFACVWICQAKSRLPQAARQCDGRRLVSRWRRREMRARHTWTIARRNARPTTEDRSPLTQLVTNGQSGRRRQVRTGRRARCVDALIFEWRDGQHAGPVKTARRRAAGFGARRILELGGGGDERVESALLTSASRQGPCDWPMNRQAR